jgi:hypothetical protein
MSTKLAPKIHKKRNAKTNLEKIWHVLLFNCECHSYDEVVSGLQEAIGCSAERALQYALVAEQFGCVSIFSGSHEECKKVERPLIRIGLRTAVEQV